MKRILKASVTNRLLPHRAFWHRLSSPLAGLVLAVSLTISGVAQSEAIGMEMPSPEHIMYLANTPDDSTLSAPAQSRFPANGIYLYGQSPLPNQIGVAYAVMEVRDRTTVGAFYMPNSSFDCFYGEVGNEHMNLTVVNTYEQEAYAYAVPLNQNTAIAATEDIATDPIQLTGYYPISPLSDMDHQILSTCKANYSRPQ